MREVGVKRAGEVVDETIYVYVNWSESYKGKSNTSPFNKYCIV